MFTKGIEFRLRPTVALLVLIGAGTAACATTPLGFVAVPPCRVADTRGPAGPFGAPSVAGQATRSFVIPSSACSIPATAQAYSLNVGVVPAATLGYLTVWPTGQTQPTASTLNSTDGRVKSAAAIVPAGTGGAISVFASNATDVVLDINGYFIDASTPAALAFYPLTPCRIADTRNPTVPSNLGGPFIGGQQTRSFPILASSCSLPNTAQAYSLNLTAVPHGSLGYLTAWPAGQAQPNVANLNATTGAVTANAAIVAPGTGGAINVFASNDTDLVIDVDGYFAPTGSPGALSLNNVTPCRVLDTRLPAGSLPFVNNLDVNVIGSVCGAPSTAKAFVFNATVVPSASLGYLTLWAHGSTQPYVSTLNATDGTVTGNLALVPTSDGIITAFASNTTHLVMDLFGYFAPVAALPGSPLITDFNPKLGPIGTPVTVTGSNLQTTSAAPATVAVPKAGGGSITVPVYNSSPGSLSFVVPAGASSGSIAITNSVGTSATASFTLTTSTTFTISASPASATLIQGQSVAYAVQMTSGNGFTQLAQLAVSGVPTGVAASFNPQSIAPGQTSILTLTAPLTQPIATSTLALTASATVEDIAVTQPALASLAVKAPTTSFLGRTVVSNATETPLGGVTATLLGKDGNGNTTGCTGQGVSDSGGNFLLANLPSTCAGPQLIAFDGTTVTSPAGKYAGVNLVFTFVVGQVTVSPVLVHLPRIDGQETFLVTQNSAVDQTYSFQTIPGLSVTAYKGTTLTMPDGTQPNPFPLVAVQVPVDRLPDLKPNVPTMIRAFIVAFQPANANASQPVAVTFPNTLNTPAGSDMALMTLDPTHGQMVPYGTGAVSTDGTQIVPDADPAHPGHRYGLVHFDWHGPMPTPPSQPNPAPPGSGGGGDGGPGNGQPPGGGPTQPTPPPVTTPISCDTKQGGNSNPTNTNWSPAQAGDPIDLYSGVQVITNMDISVHGARGSMAVVRTYRSLTTVAGPFGIGTNHNYNYALDVYPPTASKFNLITPDGNFLAFPKQPSGVFMNSTIPVFSGAKMTVNSDNSVDLRWKNGTVYHFVFYNFQIGSLLASIKDANGNTIAITRNPSVPANVTLVSDPAGRTLTFAYDSSNRIVSITDPIGRSVQYTYNGQGTLATVTDPAGGVTKYDYDSQNRMIRITDPRNIVQAFNTLDANGRVIQQTRPDGGVLTFAYTPINETSPVSQMLQTRVTDSVGVQATYRFNTTGFVSDVTATQGQTRHMERAAGTNLVTAISELTFTKGFGYDSNGNMLSSTDATGHTTQFAYDPIFNKITSITDPLGNVSRFTYDGNGNLTKSTDANGNASTYQYDSTGLLTASTDALNQTNKLAYDGYGNLISSTDPLGNTTSYLYDGISRLLATKDSLGRTTSFIYDALGRLSSRTDAKGGITKFAYDADSNLLTVTDARNNATSFTYDSLNRLLTRKDALGRTETRTYDTNGNLVKFVDRRGQTSTFVYDSLNRLTSEAYQDGMTVARTYDGLGRLARVDDSAGGAFTFVYDPAGRLTSSATQFGTVNYTYDGRGAMSSRQVVGQPVLSYSYDALGNLSSAAMPQASANFAYNARNQLSVLSRLNGVSSTYTYDQAARLLSISHAKGATVIDAENYTYDAVGNRTAHSTGTGQPLITLGTVNQFDAANRLTQFGSVPDTYDENGNLLQEGTAVAYTWDSRNRLKSIITAAGQTTTFTYDFLGNLLKQGDTGTSSNLIKTFVLDDLTNVAYETSTDGTAYSGLSARRVDTHIAVIQTNSQVQYGLTDAINSAVATVDQSGVVKSQLLYEPFGQTGGASTYQFDFTGRSPISASLYYFRARFYSPTEGRFISEDPLGLAGGDLNLFRYVKNKPVQLLDPWGLGSEGNGFTECLDECISASAPVYTSVFCGISPFIPPADVACAGYGLITVAGCSAYCSFQSYPADSSAQATATIIPPYTVSCSDGTSAGPR